MQNTLPVVVQQKGDIMRRALMRFFALMIITLSAELLAGQIFLSENINQPVRKTVIGDITNDGFNEIIAGFRDASDNNSIVVLQYQNTGFDTIWTYPTNDGWTYPLIADVDNDELNELIVASDDGDNGGFVKVFDYVNGTWNEQWSRNFSTIRKERGVSVGDVDNDGENELIVGVDWYGRQLYIFEHQSDDSYTEVWSVSGNDFRSTHVADIDNDQQNELLVGTGNWSWYDWRVYEYDGANYLLTYDSEHLGSVNAISGDANNDGLTEVIVSSTFNGGGESNLKIYSWNGTDYTENWAWNSGLSAKGAAIGNLFENGRNQIAVFSGRSGNNAVTDSSLHLFEYDGTDYVETWTSAPFSTDNLGDCQIADYDNDGYNELLFSHHADGLFIFESVVTDSVLFFEDWESGNISSNIWQQWGSPLPTIADTGYNSEYSFDPNGDSWCESGVHSVQTFSLENTVLEFDGVMTTSATYHQDLRVGFTKNTLQAGDCPEGGYEQLAYVHIKGGENRYWVQYRLQKDTAEVFEEDLDNSWHHFSMHVQADGKVAFYRDGNLVYRTEGSIDFNEFPNQRILVYGRSYYGPVYADNITLSTYDTTDPPVENDIISLDAGFAEGSESDSIISVPLYVSFPDGRSYNSAEVSMAGYSSVLSFQGIDTTHSMLGEAGWQYSSNQTDTLLLNWSAGAESISGDGVLAKLNFKASIDTCGFIPVQIANAVFDTGNDSVTIGNGGISLNANVTMYGDADVNGQIQAYDASMVLKHTVGLDELTCNGLANGDVSLDSSITAWDASLILKYGVGLIDSLPFEDSGQISGSAQLADYQIGSSGTISVPIYINTDQALYSVSGKLLFEKEKLEFLEVEWNENLSGMEAINSQVDGEIIFGKSSGQNIYRDDALAVIHFRLINESNNDGGQITLSKLQLNEGPTQNDVSTIDLSVTEVVDTQGLPTQFTVSKNYPNPFNPSTTISYGLPKSSHIKITIYNIRGEEVATLINGIQDAGWHNVVWNANDVQASSGIYLYNVKSEDAIKTGKMVLIE